MISVANEFEIDRSPASARDLALFGMESPNQEAEGADPVAPEEEEATAAVVPAGSPPRALEANGAAAGVDMNGFAIGDMVWGKVKSHPWWPGHIYNEAFASPSVRRSRRDDFVLVAFFGDSSYGYFEPAELIPYKPNFMEKSKQTTSKHFLKAVEESLDESRRRAALGISCRCRNPYNFRPTMVPDYFEVDVVGFERNAIYSKAQIDSERQSFDSKNVLGSLLRLVMAPQGNWTKDVDWQMMTATLLALRRARFEEFDETYAQAFGQEPVRPARNEMGVPEQAEDYARREAPLSGPLVIPESLSKKKKKRPAHNHNHSHSHSQPSSSSSSSSHKAKDKSSNKNRYLLKRRDDYPAAISSSSSSSTSLVLPDASSFTPPPPPLPFVLSDSPAAATAAEFVLQRREDTKSASDEPRPKSPQTPPVPGSGADETMHPVEDVAPAAVVKKEKKAKKRHLQDVDGDQGEAKRLKKKKKKKKKHVDELGQDFPPAPSNRLAGDGDFEEASVPHARPFSPLPAVDLGPLELLDFRSLYSDFMNLALNPFFGSERGAPLIVKSVFCRFRSMVFTKSLVVPSAGEGEAREQEVVPASRPPSSAVTSVAPPPRPPSKEVELQQQRDQGSSAPQPSKFMKRPDDPTRAGKKRVAPDRQGEVSAKKMKKLKAENPSEDVSTKKMKKPEKTEDRNGELAAKKTKKPEKQEDRSEEVSEKKMKKPENEEVSAKKMKKLEKKEVKAGNNPKPPEGSKDTTIAATSGAATAAAASASTEQAKKPERQEAPPLLPLPPPPPKRESPTYLIMRFPPRSTLPSVANLKARFARFGQLEVDSTRVFWKSHTCRVLFKFRADALKALNHVKSNNDIFGQIPVNYSIRELDAPGPELPSEPPSRRVDSQADNGQQFRPGNGSVGAQPMPQGKLKSILKKPGEDAGKESQRVKFMLSGNSGCSSGKLDSPPAASATLPPPPALQPQPRQTLPPPPPLHAPPSRPYEPRQYAPPTRSVERRAPLAVHYAEVEKQQQYYCGGNVEQEMRSGSGVDISHQMLSLLMRCNDIVTALQALPGYIPYQPL